MGLRGNYHAGRHASRKNSHHRLSVEIHMRKRRKKGAPRASMQEARRALEHVIETGGDIPDGWELAAIDWQARAGSAQWRTGHINDLHAMLPALQAMLADFGVSTESVHSGRLARLRPNG